MTSGAISKIAKKLIKKGIIESCQKPDNKKEIYFARFYGYDPYSSGNTSFV